MPQSVAKHHMGARALAHQKVSPKPEYDALKLRVAELRGFSLPEVGHVAPKIKRPAMRYLAQFSGGGDFEKTIEAKSDRGAARIAAGYELEKGFFRARLECLLRFDEHSRAWNGSRELDALVLHSTNWLTPINASLPRRAA